MEQEQERLYEQFRGDPEEKAQKIRWLQAYKDNYGIVACACDAIGILRQDFNEWLRDDGGFRDAFINTREDTKDSWQKVLFERARNGIKKPIIYQGKHVSDYYDQEPTVRLLELVVKGAMPGTYKERLFDTNDMRDITESIMKEAARLQPITVKALPEDGAILVSECLDAENKDEEPDGTSNGHLESSAEPGGDSSGQVDPT
jgi:hypothetical protein